MRNYYNDTDLIPDDCEITVGDFKYDVPAVDENTKIYTCSFPWFMKLLCEGRLDENKCTS